MRVSACGLVRTHTTVLLPAFRSPRARLALVPAAARATRTNPRKSTGQKREDRAERHAIHTFTEVTAESFRSGRSTTSSARAVPPRVQPSGCVAARPCHGRECERACAGGCVHVHVHVMSTCTRLDGTHGTDAVLNAFAAVRDVRRAVPDHSAELEDHTADDCADVLEFECAEER